MSARQMERLADVFAAADVTDDTIARVKDEMRGASVEEQYAILIALRNAWTTTEPATMQALVDLFSWVGVGVRVRVRVGLARFTCAGV